MKSPFAQVIMPRPWWLKTALAAAGVVGADTRWIGWLPYIYPEDRYWITPDSVVWYPLAAHENQHLLQQKAMGKWVWLAKYLFDKKFKLAQESEAVAVELSEIDDDVARAARLAEYSRQLAGVEYAFCAPSPQLARLSILAAADFLHLTV